MLCLVLYILLKVYPCSWWFQFPNLRKKSKKSNSYFPLCYIHHSNWSCPFMVLRVKDKYFRLQFSRRPLFWNYISSFCYSLTGKYVTSKEERPNGSQFRDDQQSSLFSQWRNFYLIWWIGLIGDNHTYMNKDRFTAPHKYRKTF